MASSAFGQYVSQHAPEASLSLDLQTLSKMEDKRNRRVFRATLMSQKQKQPFTRPSK
jgi:hypothetical protein